MRPKSRRTRGLRLAALLCPALLCGCQSREAREENAALSARLTVLEAKVATLQTTLAKVQEASSVHAPTVAEADDTTLRAAAQNCATELARSLESTRQDSLNQHYPALDDLDLPDSCAGENIRWQKLEPAAYAFVVQGADGKVLAQQQGP